MSISKLELITHRVTHWTGPVTCSYENGFGSHIEDGPCDLHDLSGRHSRSQQKSDSARTDEDEAFKEQDDIEDPFQTDIARSI